MLGARVRKWGQKISALRQAQGRFSRQRTRGKCGAREKLEPQSSPRSAAKHAKKIDVRMTRDLPKWRILAGSGISGRQYGACLGRGLWQQNIVSMDIRIATTSRAKDREKSPRARLRRSETTALDRGPSICPVRTRFHDVRSAVRSCRECHREGSARNAGLSCIRASSVRTSIREAGLSACSPFQSESRRRMRGISATCLRFG
jgi:hypothetical protein